jgi:RNA polymerase sigma-70 factor (ECF subfamily)
VGLRNLSKLKPIRSLAKAVARKPVQVFAPDPPARLPAAPLSQQSPEELAVRAQAGDGAATACFGELVSRFELRLFNFLLKRTRSRSDAEELTQEAFVRAWERIDTYNPAWKFSTWLYTIAGRLAISRHRKSSREVLSEQIDRGPAGPACPGRERSPIEHTEDRRAGRRLWELAPHVLTPDQHAALWLRYAEGMSIGEVAVVMKKSQVGVRVCLFRARQALAAEARSLGIVPVDGVSPAGTERSEAHAAARCIAGGTR